jgi:hypothetical protein
MRMVTTIAFTSPAAGRTTAADGHGDFAIDGTFAIGANTIRVSKDGYEAATTEIARVLPTQLFEYVCLDSNPTWRSCPSKHHELVFARR